MDNANEAVQTRRIPGDDFERELHRRVIQHETARWYDADEIHISIGETPDEEGAYDLYIWEPHDDPMRMMESRGEVSGKVWLAERESPASEYYRLAVWHQIGDDPPNTGAAPVLEWR